MTDQQRAARKWGHNAFWAGLMAPTTTVRCEASRLCDRQPCQHPAKYLAPANDKAVCGVHARAYLRCIPIAEFAPENGSTTPDGGA